MIKFGISRAEDLTPRARIGFLGSRKFVAISLYQTVARSDRDDRDAVLDHILARFATRNASLKRTATARFEAFDAALVGQLRCSWVASGTCRIHDLAVSDGRSSADLFETLVAIDGFDFQLHASDYAPDVLVLGTPAKRLQVAVDPESLTLLQIVWPPFVFNVQQPEGVLLYPVNRALASVLAHTGAARLIRRYREGDDRVQASHVWLLHPRCLELQERDPRFHFDRYDLFTPARHRFDVVRAMNVLNPSYFSERQLATAVRHIFDSLSLGGLFATGSNDASGSTVDGAIYRRTLEGFERLEGSGEGSPIDGVVSRRQIDASSDYRSAAR